MSRYGEDSVASGVLNGAVAWLAGLFVTLVLGLVGASLALTFVVDAALVEGTILGYFWLHLPVIGSGGLLFKLIPMALLVASGYHVSSKAPESGFRQGASITTGYFAFAAASMGVVFLTGIGSGVASGTDTAVTLGRMAVYVVIAGLVYPVAFGGLGGYLAD